MRLYAEPLEYRNPKRLDELDNIDRMYMAGVHIKMRAHDGENHQKTVRLIGQHTTAFGTSNWSTASDNNQLEVNYFTTKDWFYKFFADQFTWKWNNQPKDGSATPQTKEFVPLASDKPAYKAPANLATGVSPSSVTLKRYGAVVLKGRHLPWCRVEPGLLKGHAWGPGRQPAGTSDYKTVTVTGLLPGTKYSWKVVSETVANVAAEGPIWSFTTSGTAPQPPPTAPADTTPPNVAATFRQRWHGVGSTNILASPSDNVRVVGVQFVIDGTTYKTEDTSAPFSIPWDTTLTSNGTHQLQAIARDSAGKKTTSAPITVTVSNGRTPPPPSDTTKPTVAITALATGTTVSGLTTVLMASDNVGVVGVQFRVDSTNLYLKTLCPLYSALVDNHVLQQWNAPSRHSARDAAGNTSTSTVTVMVSNTGPPPPPATRLSSTRSTCRPRTSSVTGRSWRTAPPQMASRSATRTKGRRRSETAQTAPRELLPGHLQCCCGDPVSPVDPHGRGTTR